jgi:hypothetical protein
VGYHFISLYCLLLALFFLRFHETPSIVHCKYIASVLKFAIE